MSSAYDDVITKGGLKLKGGEKLAKVTGGKVSKKKKKSKADKEPSAPSLSSPPPSLSSSGGRPASAEPVVIVTKTAAQLAFEEAQRKRQRDRIHKMASKSHKEKVDDFNKYLESLSEHHDIPKVGPG